jgi:hypothetical protein
MLPLRDQDVGSDTVLVLARKQLAGFSFERLVERRLRGSSGRMWNVRALVCPTKLAAGSTALDAKKTTGVARSFARLV